MLEYYIDKILKYAGQLILGGFISLTLSIVTVTPFLPWCVCFLIGFGFFAFTQMQSKQNYYNAKVDALFESFADLTRGMPLKKEQALAKKLETQLSAVEGMEAQTKKLKALIAIINHACYFSRQDIRHACATKIAEQGTALDPEFAYIFEKMPQAQRKGLLHRYESKLAHHLNVVASSQHLAPLQQKKQPKAQA